MNRPRQSDHHSLADQPDLVSRPAQGQQSSAHPLSQTPQTHQTRRSPQRRPASPPTALSSLFSLSNCRMDEGEGGVERDQARLIVALVCDPPLSIQTIWRADPATQTRPLAIQGVRQTILAACPLARAAGVRSGQSTAQALLLCPALVLHPTDDREVQRIRDQVLTLLTMVSPVVEASGLSPDVMYLDPHGLQRLWGDVRAVAMLAVRVLAGQGITARAGGGPTRIIACALATRMPPAGPIVLQGKAARAFLAELPLADLVANLAPSLPPESVQALHELGITTAGALAALPAAGLALRFGPPILAAQRRAQMTDDPPWQPWIPDQTLTVSWQSLDGLSDLLQVQRVIDTLCHDLSVLLHIRQQAAGTLHLRIGGEERAEPVGGGVESNRRSDTQDDTRGTGDRRSQVVCRLPSAALYHDPRGTGERNSQGQSVSHWPPIQTVTLCRTLAHTLMMKNTLPEAVLRIDLSAVDLYPAHVDMATLWGRDASHRHVGNAQPQQPQSPALQTALSAIAERYGGDHIQRLCHDPQAEDGWTWEAIDADLTPSALSAVATHPTQRRRQRHVPP